MDSHLEPYLHRPPGLFPTAMCHNNAITERHTDTMSNSPTDVSTSAPRIMIAPDSYKGTATASEAAQYLGEGVLEILPNASITLAPMADGGEGTSSVFGGQVITLPTTNAAGRLTEASYTLDSETNTAYIDIAAASGLPAVADDLVPTTGDTYGTGVLIADAVTRGATRIALGLGGSATTDAGSGILIALGAVPRNKEGYALRTGGATSSTSITSIPPNSTSPQPPSNGSCSPMSTPPPPARRARPPYSGPKKVPPKKTFRFSTPPSTTPAPNWKLMAQSQVWAQPGALQSD